MEKKGKDSANYAEIPGRLVSNDLKSIAIKRF